MRWRIGEPAKDEDFKPEENGWQQVRMPGTYLFLTLATPIGIAVAALLIFAWRSLLPAHLRIGASSFGLGRAAILLYLALPFVLMGIVVLVHEGLHAVGHPGCGLSTRTTIGAWPSRFMFYATYAGPIRRNRYLVLGLLPFCVLSLLPLVACALFDHHPGGHTLLLAFVSIFNGFSSCGDLFLVPTLLWQVPAAASVRDHGWDMYWRT